MILYEPESIINYRDYGIMLPIAPDRGKKVLEFLDGKLPVLDFPQAQKSFNQIEFKFEKEDLQRVHRKEYIEKLYGDGLEAAILDAFELVDRQGNYFRYEPQKAVKPLSHLFEKLILQASGTYLASLLALESGFCYYLGGGMHHARYDKGSGFCLINDIAISAFKLLAEKPVRNIWIIDMDAHKGDGTAELVSFARDRKKLITPCSPLTLSIHMKNGWPLGKENLEKREEGRAPLLSSDVDIGIDRGEEGEYAARLEQGIKELEKIRMEKPDFAIVVDGADPYEYDELESSGLLRLSLEQCAQRDLLVYRYLKERKISSAWIQAGGYGGRSWEPHAYFLREIGHL